VVFDVDNHGLRITTPQLILKELQVYFGLIKTPGVSLVDELIRERWEEASRE
jgi:hypothetical protein